LQQREPKERIREKTTALDKKKKWTQQKNCPIQKKRALPRTVKHIGRKLRLEGKSTFDNASEERKYRG